MRIGYYPGCSLKGSSREFDESVRAVCGAIGLELVEIPDWNCCGASSAHVLDPMLSLALPGRILAQAEAAGLTEILAPCAACFNRLASAQAKLAEHPDKRDEVARIIEMPYAGKVKVLNVLEILDRHQDLIREKARLGFQHPVACYYGCLLVRPRKIQSMDRMEDPMAMDRLAEAVGATPISWSYKTECCGAAFSVTRTDLVAKLSGKILRDAHKRGAEAIVVACPMCHSNLDMRRPEINDHLDQACSLPVLFLTQIIGLALGLDRTALGLHRHMVPAELTASPMATA